MKFVLCILVFHSVNSLYGKVLPDAISQLLCRHSDPNLNECLLNNLGKILPLLADGIPTANIDPIDPVHIDFITSEGDLENIKINMDLTNVTIHGLSTIKFNKIKVDPNTMSWEILMHLTLARLTCEYHATGNLFAIPLKSSANFDGDFHDANFTLNIRFKELIRKGIRYFAAENITEKVNVDSVKINLTSIVPAEQPAVNLIQTFFNENNHLVLDTVNPLVVSQGPEHLKYILNRFLRMVPADELVPK
ncbi:uncharacterized protein CBL_12699 [Carabus blaptoides fortunei]